MDFWTFSVFASVKVWSFCPIGGYRQLTPNRKRHTGSDWHFLFTAAAREECQKAQPCSMGTGSDYLRQALQNNYTASTLR